MFFCFYLFLKKWHFDLIFMDNIVKWQKKKKNTFSPLSICYCKESEKNENRKKDDFYSFWQAKVIFCVSPWSMTLDLCPPPLIAVVTSAVNFHILRADSNKNSRENIWLTHDWHSAISSWCCGLQQPSSSLCNIHCTLHWDEASRKVNCERTFFFFHGGGGGRWGGRQDEVGDAETFSNHETFTPLRLLPSWSTHAPISSVRLFVYLFIFVFVRLRWSYYSHPTRSYFHSNLFVFFVFCFVLFCFFRKMAPNEERKKRRTCCEFEFVVIDRWWASFSAIAIILSPPPPQKKER